MQTFLTIFFTLFAVGTINFFYVLIAKLTDYDKEQTIYIYLTVGLGWVWLLVIKPLDKIYILLKKGKNKWILTKLSTK